MHLIKSLQQAILHIQNLPENATVHAWRFFGKGASGYSYGTVNSIAFTDGERESLSFPECIMLTSTVGDGSGNRDKVLKEMREHLEKVNEETAKWILKNPD